MELSWINKYKALFYELDEDGMPKKPIWIDKNDYRFNQNLIFKLFHTYGDKNPENRLIHGDNLLALKLLANEFENKPDNKKVKCIYIDPPYNTEIAFNAYNDNFEHSEWLGMMYPRINLLKDLLQEKGVIFVQIDEKEQAYLCLIMNSIFKEENKIGTIIWRRRQSQANLSGTVSTIHDYILIYSKNKQKVNNSKLKSSLWVDTSKYGYNQQGSEEMEAYFGNKNAFDTPKPELLMYNILKIATKENDLVLDSFLGSGTTVAVAHKMKRRWIGIEMSNLGFSLSETRLKMIINTNSQKDIGITKIVKWRGGGGFKTYKLKISPVYNNYSTEAV